MTELLVEDEIAVPERPSRLRGRSGWSRVVALAIVGGAVLAGNLFLKKTEVNTVTTILLLISLGMAWNLIAGFGGQFSLGHSIFVGVGGYATAVMLTETSLPVPLVIVAAALVAALLGTVLGYPLLRLRGPYFSIGTLALTFAVIGWMLNWELTGKSQAYSLPADALLDVRGVYTIASVITVLIFVVVFAVMRMPIGLRLLALRDSEQGATSIGIRRTTTLMPIWALSAFLTGLVGAAYALQKGTLDPQTAFSLNYTIDAVVVVVLGGLGTMSGPVLGGLVIFGLRHYTSDLEGWSTLIEALVVVVMVRFIPGGLVGVISQGYRRARRASLYRLR